MKGQYTVNTLVTRFQWWTVTHEALDAIRIIINYPINSNNQKLPQNMKQRMADLLQLRLVQLKLL